MAATTPIRILIVEDFHAETEMLLMELRDAEMVYELAISRDEATYKEELQSFHPDVILSPYSLKGTNAIKLLGIARKSKVEAPFILLAFDLSEDIAIDLLGEGIEDYVQQSTLKRLPVAIRKALQRYKTQLELQISEGRLRASEEAMRNMVRNAPIAVAMFDMDMNYLVVSETWLAHEEKTEEIIGENHYKVVPEIPDSWKEIHQKVLAGEIHGSEREKMERADGSVEILRWKMNPWYNHDGDVGGAVLFIEDISEKESIRIELEQNEQVQAIGEHLSKSGSFELTIKTGQVHWSKNMYEITGFKDPDPVSNEVFFAQVHPEDQEAYASTFAKVMETQNAVPFEYRFIRPDNKETIYLNVHSTFIHDGEGNAVSLIGSVRDITLIRLAQLEIEKSQRLLTIGEGLSDSGSYEFDLTSETMRWSQNMYKIKGFKANYVFSGEGYLEHIHPEDRKLYQEEFSKVLSSKKSKPFEYRLIRPKDGKVVYLRVHSSVIKNENDEPISVMGSVQDVTAKHLADQELKSSEASLKTAQQIAKIGNWAWVRDEKYVTVSDEVKAIYETKKKRFTIEDIRSFIHPDDLLHVEKVAAKDLTDEIVPVIDYRIVTAKGNLKHVVSSAKQVLDSGGQVVKLIGTLQDVTDRISIEKELTEKESLLREMAESINDVFWVTNAEGDEVLYMSPRYEEVYGMSIESVFADGNSWAENIHPEDKPMVFKEWEINRLNGKYNVEFRLIHPNGETKWLHAKAFPVKNEVGNVVRMAGITHDITERRETENTVRESEHLLRQMAESIDAVFWITDWKFKKCLYVSAQFERLYELPLNEIYEDATAWEKVMHPEDLDRVSKAFRDKAHLGTYLEECRLLMPDGRIKWIRDRAFPILDENGTVVRVAGLTEDITESRELQDDLKEQEELLRQMAENISGVFYLSDWANDKVLYASPQYEELYGLKLNDLYKDRSHWKNAVHPDDLDRLLQTFNKVAAKGVFDHEFRLVMKDGTVKWVRDRTFPIEDENGVVTRVAGLTEDITLQKAAEEQIETLSLVASETVNGVLIHDAEGKVLWANKGFTTITGYDAEEVVGKEPWSLVAAPETNQKLIELTYQKISQGKPFSSDNQLLHKDGRVRWVNTSFTPILDSAGNISKVVSIGTDISKQKELEELQRSMLTRMEARVVERTSELESTNQELRKEIWEKQRISDELYHHNLDLKDSIEYAKRIQESILPEETSLQKSFPHGFVLFLPRDVVSGDFYWYFRRNNLSYFAAIDCTGHGVPGALMSMIANELMNQAIIQKKLTDPAEILTQLNKLMVRTLRQKNENNMRDGMDVSLIVVDHDRDKLTFGGALSSMYIFQDGEMAFYPGTRHSIGGHLEDVKKNYESVNVKLKKGASIYLSTDGYIDQFGGPDGKKLMKKRFAQILESIQSLPMDKQKEALLQKFVEWKGPLNQVDDVLVAGLTY